jgi:ABC-type amino acid transport substrate-binding protein
MKSRLAVLFIVLSTVLLSSCANLMGPREVELSAAQLQEALSRKFPFNSRMLELFNVNLTNPRLALQPQTNRVVTSLDASVAPPFTNKAWNGSFTISGRLALDPARRAVVLAEPRVENLALSGIDSAYATQINKIGAILAEQLLKDLPLYTFGPDEFRYAGTNFIPSQITTKPSGLVVTFVPAR